MTSKSKNHREQGYWQRWGAWIRDGGWDYSPRQHQTTAERVGFMARSNVGHSDPTLQQIMAVQQASRQGDVAYEAQTTDLVYRDLALVQGKVVWDIYVNRMTQTTIAEALNRNQSNVSRLHDHACEHLRKMLRAVREHR